MGQPRGQQRDREALRGERDLSRGRRLRLLLDTNALIWWRADPSRLSAQAYKAVASASNVVLTSAAAVWEISIKSAAGRLQPPVDDLRSDLRLRRIGVLAVTAEHAWAAGQLPRHHGDPFDRVIVAQAQLEGLTIVTRDPDIARYQVAILPA